MADSWTASPLGDVAPARPATMPDEDREVWNLSLDEIEPGTGRVLSSSRCLVRDLGSAKCSFDARHVLYSKLRPYLNKVVVPDKAGVGTSELIPLLPDERRLDREYLAFYLRSPQFLDFAAANTRGANLPRIAMRELWAHEVPFPMSLQEQRRIVCRISGCIDRVEEVARLRVQSIAQAQAALPSTLSEVFDDVSAAYGQVAIGEVAVETRYGTSQKCSGTPNGMPILRIPNVAGGFVNFSDIKYCALDEAQRARIELEEGDLLFVRTNGSRDLVGRCAIYEAGDGAQHGFASYLIRVRLDKKRVLPHYLAFFLNSTHGRVEIDERRRTSAGQFNINSKNLRSIPFPLPPLDEQHRVVDSLKDREATILRLQGVLQEARREERLLPESILKRAFAGEL